MVVDALGFLVEAVCSAWTGFWVAVVPLAWIEMYFSLLRIVL